jgi:hypothetical protein
MSIRVAPYEAPMAAQVAELFHRQYGVDRDAFAGRFVRFYEHEYQRGRCLRVVALEGETVAGFAGFVRWPYARDGRVFDSFQCCDVLLDPRSRGRGQFQRMLDFAGEQLRGADFLVGFPVEAAKSAFLRNGWKNVLDLQWYVKVLSLRVMLSRADGEASQDARSSHSEILRSAQDDGGHLLRLTNDPDFVDWRHGYSHHHLHFDSFELKPIRRRRLLRELIVGDVRRDDADFAALAKAVRGTTYLSIAMNPLDPLVARVLAAGFRRVKRTIAFIVKPLAVDATDPAKWRLFRSDIDTW